MGNEIKYYFLCVYLSIRHVPSMFQYTLTLFVARFTFQLPSSNNTQSSYLVAATE